MVHPHLRGAYAALPRQQLIFPGSSPHTWGIRGRFQSRRLEQRFIPTYVGHTAANVFASACTSGSSPHTWGILERVVNHFRDLRFIPTYVGHTDGRLSIQLIPAGSSPPTWGIPVCTRRTRWNKSVHPHLRGAYRCWCYCCSSGRRFIPTYVGHTVFSLPMARRYSVHPHLRGAYVPSRLSIPSASGSSPPTWGIHWTAVRKMAGFSHFSYDFIRKSYFVQGLVFFGVIGAEASPTHRRGRSQCLSGSHGGNVRNL